MQSHVRIKVTVTMLLLVTLAIFMPVLWHDFVIYDDPAYVLENSHVRSGLTLEGLRWAFTSGFESNWFPVTRISHMLDVQLFGMNPAGHHGVSALIHAISTALLFALLQRTTCSYWLSLATALLFGLHPLRVESVAWISERKDVLCTLFGILTLIAYAGYAQTRRLRDYLTALTLFSFGLMSKPMLVSLPALLLLLDWWPLGRWESARANVNFRKTAPARLLAEKIPFVILAACSSLITYLVQHSAGTVTQTYTLPVRIERACVSYLVYLGKTAWPAKLAVIYPFSKYPPTPLALIAAALTILTVTLVAIRFRSRAPYLLTGWLWYLVALLPVIGIIQVGQHSVADRYTYLPHIGIFMLLTWGTAAVASRWDKGNPVLRMAFALTLAALIVTTSRQLAHWKDSITLFTHTLRVTENNWVAHTNLGLVFLEKGLIDEAIVHFREAVKAKPSYVPAYQNMGFAFRAKGDLVAAQEAYRTAVMIEPTNPKSHLGLGLLYTESGNREGALQEYRTLQQLHPEFAQIVLRAVTENSAFKP